MGHQRNSTRQSVNFEPSDSLTPSIQSTFHLGSVAHSSDFCFFFVLFCFLFFFQGDNVRKFRLFNKNRRRSAPTPNSKRSAADFKPNVPATAFLHRRQFQMCPRTSDIRLRDRFMNKLCRFQGLKKKTKKNAHTDTKHRTKSSFRNCNCDSAPLQLNWSSAAQSRPEDKQKKTKKNETDDIERQRGKPKITTALGGV